MSKSHKSTIRERTIKESICTQKGCLFNGSTQQQGVCHTTDPFVTGMSWKYLDQLEKDAENYIKQTREVLKKDTDKDKIAYLESLVICHWIDQIVHLDELVSLRRQNAILKLKASKK